MYLHLVVECALDLANHCIVEADLRTPETNQDSFLRLEEAGEIGPGLASRLRSWAGFRNIAIHDNRTLNLDVVKTIITSHFDDFPSFVAAMLQSDPAE